MFKKTLFLLGIIFSGLLAKAVEPDTTSARVYFQFNKPDLTPAAKLILNDVPPGDSSITLIRIRIYGNALSKEKNTNLAVKRANNIKKYLMRIGINPAIISTFAVSENGTALPQQNDEVVVTILIDYDAAVIERTIIIKPPAKQTDYLKD